MSSHPAPIDREASRFRLPVAPPTRNLIIASLASIAGACQLFAWALARMPAFFLAFGIFLMMIAIGLALAALIRHYRLRWVIYVGPRSLTVVRGTHREVMTWTQVAAVRYERSRIEVLGVDDGRLCSLPVDRTRAADEAARDVLQAIESHVRA